MFYISKELKESLELLKNINIKSFLIGINLFILFYFGFIALWVINK